MNRNFTLHGFLVLVFVLIFNAGSSFGQVIYQHDFGSTAISGKPYTVAPNILNGNLSGSSWTTSATAFTSYSGSAGQAIGLGNVNGTQTITLTFNVSPGYICNITSFSFWRQRSGTGPVTLSMIINGKSVGEIPNTPTTGANVGNTTIQNFNNLTGTVTIQLILAEGAGGTFRLDDFTLNGSVVQPDVVSDRSGYWNSGSTWVGGNVPNDNQKVLINEAHTVHVDGTSNPTRNADTYVNGTFQINDGGYISGSPQFIYGLNGTLNFNTNAEYGVNDGAIFWPWNNGPVNVQVLQGGSHPTGGLRLNNLSRIINGSLILSSGVSIAGGQSLTVNGTCQINTDGWATNSLDYGTEATLIYNTGGVYNNGNEWTTLSNPANVVLKGNTILDYPANGIGARSISGNLTIEAGSALDMDYGAPIPGVSSLTIGDLFLYGNLSLGNQVGGDLKTTGDLNFYSGSAFNPNNRAIFFIKNGTQTINNTAATPLNIPYVVIGGGSGTTVQMNTDILISAPNTGNAIAFTNASDVLDINNRTLTIGTNATNNQITGPGSFKGSATSNLVLLGNGNIGTINFSGSPGLNSLTINRSAGALAVNLGSPLTIHNNLSLTNGHISLGANNLQLQPAAIITDGGANSYVQANGAGKLVKYFHNKNQWIDLPVGGNQYSPIKYQVTEGTLINNNTFLSVNLVETRHPQNTISTSHIKRFWNVSVSGLTNYKADAEFNYLTGDVVGTEANIKSAAWDESLWQMDNPANVINHSVSFTGTDNLSRAFTGGNKFAPLASQPTNYFRSKNTGNWNDINTWESSYDGITWEDATLYPTSDAKGILIRGTVSHTVTLAANTTAKLLTIEAGGTLTNSGAGGGFDLTIADDGTTEPDFKIYGTYLLFGKQPIFNPGATARVYANGLVRADENIGGQSEDFASSIKVTFNTKAVFEWNINKPFKTSGAIYFPNSDNEIPIFRVSIDPVSGGTGIIIKGILDVNTDFTFMGGNDKTFRNGIVGNSTLTQTATSGNFIINGPNAILGGSALKIALRNPLNLQSSVTIPEDSIVTISGANLNNSKSGNIFTIEGILDATSINIVNPLGAINVKGVYKTTHVGGFSGAGASIVNGVIELQSGSTIELYHVGNQFLRVRPDFSNVVFSGSGRKTVSTAFVPQGTITIKDDAILDAGIHNIGDANTHLTMTDNSRLILNTGGPNPGADGVYNLTGGVIEFKNSDLTKQTIRGTYGPTPGVPIVYNNIEVTGTSVGNGAGNINLREGGMFTVKSGAKFEINANAIKGVTGSAGQQVIVESGAEFITGNKLGFHGLESLDPISVSSIHLNITNIILHQNSTVNYHRENPIQTGGHQIITASTPYQHLIISGNQEKTAQENGIIQIKGNLNKTTDAIFKHNTSTVVFNGTTATQNYHSANPQMVFNNLTNENTVGLNIQDSLSVFKALTLATNSKLNINADITLQSNADNTANVAPILAGASINYSAHNRFIVERYIPDHRKAWQFIATPVIGDQTIHKSWQEGMAPGMNEANNTAGAPGNLRPGYGTTITSDKLTWAADGFDRFTAPGPSLKTYNSLTKKWEGVPSTNIPVQNQEGYMLMVRGDRSVITHKQDPTATTLRTRGKIYAPGTLPSPPSTTVPNTPGTFVSIGNPYASAIDFYASTRSNLSESYIIWDPQLTDGPSQYGLGAYRTISNGFAVPSSGNYTDGNIPPIQSGQAFFVQLALSATGAGAISFTENSKTSGSSPVFRGGNTFTQPEAHLRADLYVHTKDGSILLDGNLVQLHNQYSPSLDELDVVKMMNTGENLGIFSHSKTLAIERKPLFQEADTVFYSLGGLKKQTYELEFISQKTDVSGLDAYLEDVFLNQQTLLDPSGTTMIGFEVNNDAGSYNRNRFRVIFKDARGPLPVTITQFTAEAQNKEVLVQWLSENESGIEKYIVEKSANGVEFNPLGELMAKNGSGHSYFIMDKAPEPVNNYYRLKIIHRNGKTEYSNIVKVTMNTGPALFSLYPNPVINGRVNVHFSNQAAGMYSMRLLSVTGQSMLSKDIYYNGQTTIEMFNIENKPEGIYYLEILKPGGERTLLKVIK